MRRMGFECTQNPEPRYHRIPQVEPKKEKKKKKSIFIETLICSKKRLNFLNISYTQQSKKFLADSKKKKRSLAFPGLLVL